MILAFSEICVVKFINCPKSIKNFLIHENIINHVVNNSANVHSIQVEFKKLTDNNALQILHPNACVTNQGFAFHDKNKKLIYPNYDYKKQIKILTDFKIDPIFFWDILFDHIKLFLLKNNVVTLHAAGLEKNNFAKLFFGWANDIADFLNNPPAGPQAPVFQFLHGIAAFPKPVLASVCGPAVGIGSTLLLHCDLVYAGDNAVFSMPFVNLGLVPEAASSYMLPQLMGYHRAAEVLLMGRLTRVPSPRKSVAYL